MIYKVRSADLGPTTNGFWLVDLNAAMAQTFIGGGAGQATNIGPIGFSAGLASSSSDAGRLS